MLFIIDSNRSYFQDERHQRAIAANRGRPPERVGVGIAIDDPAIDHAQLARGFGLNRRARSDDFAELEAALRVGVAKVAVRRAVRRWT